MVSMSNYYYYYYFYLLKGQILVLISRKAQARLVINCTETVVKEHPTITFRIHTTPFHGVASAAFCAGSCRKHSKNIFYCLYSYNHAEQQTQTQTQTQPQPQSLRASNYHLYRSRGDLLKAFLQLPADYSQLATV